MACDLCSSGGICRPRVALVRRQSEREQEKEDEKIETQRQAQSDEHETTPGTDWGLGGCAGVLFLKNVRVVLDPTLGAEAVAKVGL